MRVRLVRKLAGVMDGIDVTHCDVGELIDLPDYEAHVLIAGRWADPARRQVDGDRRAGAGIDDMYQRLKEKRDEIERDRRGYRRRATDAAPAHLYKQ